MHIDRLSLTYAGGVLVLIALVLGGGLIYYKPGQFASAEELEALNMGFLLAPMLAAVGITLLAIAGAIAFTSAPLGEPSTTPSTSPKKEPSTSPKKDAQRWWGEPGRSG